MKILFVFLSVFWHKYIPVLRKTSKKKGQSVKPKANDTDPVEIHIISSSSDDDFKSPLKKKKPCNRGKKIKNFWAKQTLYRYMSYTNIMFFILTQNQYAFVSTECKKVPLQCQQYI